MFVATHMAGFGAGKIFDASLYGIIRSLGLHADLMLCLDAGNADSYPGSGQQWLDQTPNDMHFYLGADGSAGANDPTFNGTAGDLSASEYFSMDGGDFFRLAQTNPSWVDDMHKDGAAFTILFYLHFISSASNFTYVGSRGASATNGFELRVDNAWVSKPNLVVTNGASTVLTAHVDNALTNDTDYGIAASVDEAGASGIFWRNGAYDQVSSSDTFDPTYSSPAAGAAGYTLEIGAAGNAAVKVPNNTLMYAAAIWSRALSKAELDKIHALFGPRLGL